MLTPNEEDTFRWRVIYCDGDGEPPMAVELHSFNEAWSAAIAYTDSSWTILHKDSATSWFSSNFTRFQPLTIAYCGLAKTKIQMIY